MLTRLLPGEGGAILERANRLEQLDAGLSSHARSIEALLDGRAEVEQKLAAALDAERALAAFADAGLDSLRETQRLGSAVETMAQTASEIRRQALAVVSALRGVTFEESEQQDVGASLERTGVEGDATTIRPLLETAVDRASEATAAVGAWGDELGRVGEALGAAEAVDQQRVEKRLAELGYGAEKLAEFQTLSARASGVSRERTAFEAAQAALDDAVADFDRDREERRRIVTEQRKAFDRIRESVAEQFDGRIRVRRIEHGDAGLLGEFLQGLRQKGITQWWHGLAPGRRPSAESIFAKLQSDELGDLGVSDTVAERFRESISEARKYQLLALRSPDRYVLEHRIGEGEYRDASRLSGGKRVSLLLSLLLQAHDERPLVIDQPEDELDGRFLWEEVLPALRRLKGRRQIIVATHDANVVVNADADLVVLLEADAEHGRVALAGAIEDPRVRRAIIETVDGGEQAFELRQTKYGF